MVSSEAQPLPKQQSDLMLYPLIIYIVPDLSDYLHTLNSPTSSPRNKIFKITVKKDVSYYLLNYLQSYMWLSVKGWPRDELTGSGGGSFVWTHTCEQLVLK